MPNGEVSEGADVEVPETDWFVFATLVRGLFERRLLPGHLRLVFVRGEPYNLVYHVLDTRVYRVYICDDGRDIKTICTFDFDANRQNVVKFSPDLDTVKRFVESFIVAGHW